MDLGLCDKCKKYDGVSQYRYWFLCGNCMCEVLEIEEKNNVKVND
jgi:hypothetical protein